MTLEPDPPSELSRKEFEKAGQQKQNSLIVEFLLFVREDKKWWMIPILLVLGFVGLLIVLASTGAAPFIYSLF